MKKFFISGLLVILAIQGSLAQETFPRNDVQDSRHNAYALTNATIYIDYNTKVDQGTLLIKDGKVERVVESSDVPKGYFEINCEGKYIYPSFIELHSSYGLPKTKPGRTNFFGPEQIAPKSAGAYNANDAIKAHVNAADNFKINAKSAASMRKQGFGTVLTHHQDGIARGTSTLVALGETTENESILVGRAAAHYSFRKGTSRQSYPVSAMGSVALLRQTYMDARWYKNGVPFTDLSLESWNKIQTLPQIFDGGNKYAIIRADEVGDEFNVQYIIKGNGTEYQRIREVKNTKAPLVVPINFPKAFDVDNVYESLDISLAELKHWELAPTNLKVLEDNNIKFAVTSADLSGGAGFLANLRKAVEFGLSESGALKALTQVPAELLRVNNRIGSLKNGRIANFLVVSGNIFEQQSNVLENWVQGKQFVIKKDAPTIDEGNYELTIGSQTYNVEKKKKAFKIVVNDSTKIKLNAKVVDNVVTFTYKPEGQTELIRLSGWRKGKDWQGQGQMQNGDWTDWSLTYQSGFEEEQAEQEDTEKSTNPDQNLGDVIYPFQAYGQAQVPTVATTLIKNTTVWTNEDQGILTNTDVLLKDGKINKIGKNLSAPGAVEIDGAGMHLTPGIIDEHSHIALFNVNDVAVNSGMVRMKDVVDPDDIDIYRQLSGGVTAAQLLHGSANPVGGQSALIKLRWGLSPSEMLIDRADGFIKFALGENVKRSRNPASIRYPQTRMGVEQIYVDAFTEALEYQKKWTKYNGLSSKEKAKANPPRKDLIHEAMLEILNEKRFITCHSYVQSEINMLMKVAERFGFKVNTFTHILEGYKVADKMKEHGAGASTFADWWAYKWEVRYAIPYNPALMNGVGVTVAINSDDAEMGRRLNQEAAKSLKYGGMDEQDALKMVTLNPAKLLHLDDRTGSIRVGKDADVVLWNDHPLSIYAKAEKTIVDGVVYFDREKDKELREGIKTERARIIQKMKSSKANGAPTRPPVGSPNKHFHCDTMVHNN